MKIVFLSFVFSSLAITISHLSSIAGNRLANWIDKRKLKRNLARVAECAILPTPEKQQTKKTV